MQILRTTYLSIGTNQGDTKKNLQNAVDFIDESIGSVQAISAVYKTAAWGFKGDDFYNIGVLSFATIMRNAMQAMNLKVTNEGDTSFVGYLVCLSVSMVWDELYSRCVLRALTKESMDLPANKLQWIFNQEEGEYW